MPRYADDSKEKVREAVDMVDLVSTRTELRRAGPGRFKGLCPFHEERTPSFSVNADDGFYHCFGCGVGGDAFRFVMETEGLDFVGALESLAQRYGVEIAVEDEDPAAAERRRQRDRLLALLERAASFYEKWLWDSAEAAPARSYLAERGLSDETLRTFRVGYAPSAWDKLLTAGRQGGYGNKELFDAGLAVRAKGEGRIYDRFRRRIMFPLSDARGRILGFGARALGTDQQPKYLNSADGEVFTKGDMVFGAHLARVASARADEVIVAEGYTDVLALHQAGMQNVVGIMGTALTEKQVGELAKLGKTILLALDADSAGQEAMLRAARLAAGRQLQLRVVPLPKGLDPADLVQQQGADAARALVESSVPFVRFQIERELERGDLTQAEGKDAVIAALKPAFATLPPSALREELLAHVADRVDLAPSLVSSWLPAPGGPGASGHGGGGNGSGWGNGGLAPRREPEALPVSSDPAVRAERALLAYCVGMQDDGRDTLSRLPDEAFTDDLNRRAASYLREHWAAPVHGLAEGDDEPLRRLIVGLVAAADQSDLSRAVLQSQLARVELAHINRQIASAKAARSGGITELVARRANVEQRLHQHLGERMDEGRPTD